MSETKQIFKEVASLNALKTLKIAADASNTSWKYYDSTTVNTGKPDVDWNVIIFVKDIGRIFTHGVLYYADVIEQHEHVNQILQSTGLVDASGNIVSGKDPEDYSLISADDNTILRNIINSTKVTGTTSNNYQFISSTDKTKLDTLTSQTSYSKKGTSTKVPQVSTNTLGQVTGVSEVDIDFPTNADTIDGYHIEVNNTSGTTAKTIYFVI